MGRVPFSLSVYVLVVVFPVGSAQTTFLDKKEVTARVLDSVKRFPKVNQAKVTDTASFTNDLGLDSLDQVELVMALEDEFKVDIPDAEARHH